MKKLHYSYSGHGATIFFNAQTGEIVNTWDLDTRVQMHQDFGGDQYYRSRSGLSGAGYFEVENNNQFVELASYREDISLLNEGRYVELGRYRVSVPSRLTSGKPQLSQHPIVVYDTEKSLMIFLRHAGELLDFMRGTYFRDDDDLITTARYKNRWGGIEIVIDWHRRNCGNLRELNEYLPYTFWSFVKMMVPELIKNARIEQESVLGPFDKELNHQNPIIEKMKYRVYQMPDGDGEKLAVHRDRLGLIDDITPLDAFTPKPDDDPASWPCGWTTYANLAFKRRGNEVYAIYACKPSELSGRFRDAVEKRVKCNQDGSEYEYEFIANYCEYEKEFSVFEFFAKSIQDHAAQMRKDTFNKYQTRLFQGIYASHSKEQRAISIRRILEKNTSDILTVQDSLDAGNCRPGTERFIEQYGLNDEMPVNELLEHRSIEAVLSSPDFEAVVINKYKLNRHRRPQRLVARAATV